MIRLPDGPFDLIMADPPWHFSTWSEEGAAKSPQAQYRTMSLTQIGQIPVASVAAPDCLLWLWITGPLSFEGHLIAQDWGFQVKTMGWWSKEDARLPGQDRPGVQDFGTGYLLRNAGEPFLICTRGAPKVTRGVRNTIRARRREHSRKPDEAYLAAEALMPGARRLDLFSRQRRPGWVAFGDQTDHFEGVA